LSRREHLAALRRAILELPVPFREAVVLCDLQELSYADAASALGCAVGTVRSRLHRGRARLARRLRDIDGRLKPAATKEGCVASAFRRT
jgi:RNA polymerase sigma-70 factor (ECF subfamily)